MDKTNRTKGFTLIELLVTVTIITILMLAVYPSYTHHTLKAQRLQAKAQLTALAQQLEHYHMLHHTYQIPTNNMHLQHFKNHAYKIMIAKLSPQHFQIDAIPITPAAKLCGRLSLDQSGRYITNSNSHNNCW